MCFGTEILVLLIGVAIAYVLVVGRLGRRKGKRGFRFSLLALFGLLCIAGVISLHMKMMYDQRTPRPVVSPSEYPLELRDLLELSEQRKVDVEVLKVHCLSDGVFYEEYYWQTKASPELLELSVSSHWELSPVDKNSSEVRLFWERMPVDWNASRPDEADYYISSTWIFTEWGAILMHDKKAQRFYYWYMYDF